MNEKDYSPKLRRIADEIRAILEREDIAGTVLLHEATPNVAANRIAGFGEFVHHISPSYSAVSFEGEGIRMRAVAADFNPTNPKAGDPYERNILVASTENMINHLMNMAGQAFMFYQHLEKALEDNVGKPQHTKGKFTPRK